MVKTPIYFLIFFIGLLLVLGAAGLLFLPRAGLPPLITGDYCQRYNIQLDGTSIETIYLSPQTILASPEMFLNEDRAYRLLAQSRAKGAEPFQIEEWRKSLVKLASEKEEKRRQHSPFRLYQLIFAHQQAFCKEIGSTVQSYLPEITDLHATIYLTALDEPVPAYFDGEEIVFSLSHPLFVAAAMIHEPTGLSTFFNLALQELFHTGFVTNYQWPSIEEHRENEVVIDILINLQNEGMGTHIEKQLFEQCPSPFEWFLYLVDKKTVVRWYIEEINKLLAIAKTKPEGAAYEEIYSRIGDLCYRKKGFYIAGAYMARTIEKTLGREALTGTITQGYQAFADAYNSLVEKDMQINWR